jgi:hypothetical protein
VRPAQPDAANTAANTASDIATTRARDRNGGMGLDRCDGNARARANA